MTIEDFARQKSIEAVMQLYWTTQTSDDYPTMSREHLMKFMKEQFGMDAAEVDELISAHSLP